jgi:hypothetical protein
MSSTFFHNVSDLFELFGNKTLVSSINQVNTWAAGQLYLANSTAGTTAEPAASSHRSLLAPPWGGLHTLGNLAPSLRSDAGPFHADVTRQQGHAVPNREDAVNSLPPVAVRPAPPCRTRRRPASVEARQ